MPSGRGRSRPVPARPYRDYAEWLGEQRPERAQEHWRELMDSFSVPTPLPFERETTAEQGHERKLVRIDRELDASLQAVARRYGLTVNTLVQGAWALVLGTHCQVDDIVFGATVWGRPPELPALWRLLECSSTRCQSACGSPPRWA